MAKKGKTRKVKTGSARGLHTYINGLIMICLILTVIGSAVAGASVITITWRAFTVFCILWCLGFILKKCWHSMEEINRARELGGVKRK